MNTDQAVCFVAGWFYGMVIAPCVPLWFNGVALAVVAIAGVTNARAKVYVALKDGEFDHEGKMNQKARRAIKRKGGVIVTPEAYAQSCVAPREKRKAESAAKGAK